MSWQPWQRVRDSVLRDPASSLTANERLVAVVVADCLDAAGEARRSVALIAKRSGLACRTVQRALAELTKPGGIFTEFIGGSNAEGGRRSSVYRLATRATLTRYARHRTPVRPAPQ
jgi:Helix-turn-helix domain